MPPPKIPLPQFSPVGRYLINVEERKIEGPTYFHDTQNFKEECGIEKIATSSASRFDNPDWARQRGYTQCQECMPE